MKRNIRKYLKWIMTVILIISMIMPSYATLSASDGAAFVTKAEFDSALAEFNSRLTTFEAGINSKIDSQVTTYLDRNGIWSGKEQTMYRGTTTTAIGTSGSNADLAAVGYHTTFVTNQSAPSFLYCLANVTPNKSGLFYINLKCNSANYGGCSYPLCYGISQFAYDKTKVWTVSDAWDKINGHGTSHYNYGGAIFIALVDTEMRFGQRVDYSTMSVPMQYTIAEHGGRDTSSSVVKYPVPRYEVPSTTTISATPTILTAMPSTFNTNWFSGQPQTGWSFPGGYGSTGKRYVLSGFVSKSKKYYLNMLVSFSANISTSSDVICWFYELAYANQAQGFSLESAIIY